MPMPTDTGQARRVPRWGLVGVLCALVLGLVGLYGLEVHCSEQAVQHAVQTVLTTPDQASAHHGAQVETVSQQADPFAGGDLLLCALVASCVALLFAAVIARRRGDGWLMPARRFRPAWPSLPALLPPSSIAITPLRC